MPLSWLKRKFQSFELYTVDVVLGRRADTGAVLYGMFLQVLSWLVVNLFPPLKGDHFDLGIGYFIWLLSFILLVAAHFVRSGPAGQPVDPGLAPGPLGLGEKPGRNA